MSLHSLYVSGDLREQVKHTSSQGRKAGRNFVKSNKHKDKIWFGGFLDEVEDRVTHLELPKAVEAFGKDVDKQLENNPLASATENVHKMLDPSSWATDFVKGNLPKAALKAGISCAIFHEVKERGIKPASRRVGWKHAEPVTCYACDIVFSTPLYGPFFTFLIGKAREYVVHEALSALGVKTG